MFPSFTLHRSRKTHPPDIDFLMSESEPIVASKAPAVLNLEPGEYWWCSCGRSEDQPFCDGSHKGTGFTPERIEIKEGRNYALCNCKHSSQGAMCDGSHSSL